MESIIGREVEIKRLTAAVNSPRPEFIALYGRRRAYQHTRSQLVDGPDI